MLEMVTATRFDRRMTNGKTKPCLMACDGDDNAELELVVKLSGGCERGAGGLAIEAIVAMFAADLELPVPQPYLVRVEPALVQLIPDAEIRALAAKSSNVAFGSRLLPPSHSVWLHSRAIPQALQQQAAEIFALDALLLNADRRPANPNCQSNGSTFAIYDHELCFLPPLFAPVPWVPNGLEYLRADEASHLFRAGLRGTLVDLARFTGAVEAVTPARIQQYLAALPTEWQAAEPVAAAAADHLASLRDNIEAAITEVIRVLS
jgi:hypothetical protein